MSDRHEHLGAFGKLPQQADYISLHLGRDFTEYWHGWAQAGVSVSREQLGEDWLPCWLEAPLWRFALSPGLVGECSVLGVWMPSVDEVGRYFPLTLAQAAPVPVWSACLDGDGWYDAAETVALSALAEATGYRQWVSELEALAPAPPAELGGYVTQPSAQGEDRAWAVELPAAACGAALARGLLDRSYGRALGPYSLWWTRGASRVDPCLLLSAGLPRADQFSAMLDGDWARWGWAREQLMSAGAAP